MLRDLPLITHTILCRDKNTHLHHTHPRAQKRTQSCVHVHTHTHSKWMMQYERGGSFRNTRTVFPASFLQMSDPLCWHRWTDIEPPLRKSFFLPRTQKHQYPSASQRAHRHLPLVQWFPHSPKAPWDLNFREGARADPDASTRGLSAIMASFKDPHATDAGTPLRRRRASRSVNRGTRLLDFRH